MCSVEYKRPKKSELEVKAAIRKILSDTKSYHTSLNYAVNYCRAALFMSEYELKFQIPYILNNIPRWRGKGNKEIRQLLKDYIKT